MHSALPQTSVDGKFYPRKSSLPILNSILPYLRSPVARTVGVILAFFLTAYMLVFGLSPDKSSLSNNHYTKLSNGAETVVYTTSPFIYPDVSRLSQYRTTQYITLDNGKIVDSRKHAIIYNGPKPGPSIVLVIGLDSESYSEEYLKQVLDDRIAYAKKHGYGIYARYLKDFVANMPGGMDDPDTATQFAKLFLVREAMYSFKDSKWMWWLDQDSVIMDHEFELQKSLLEPNILKDLIIRDAPILPPSSVVHTYKRVPAEKIRFITTQNDRGISTSSFLISNDKIYGHILTGYWMDPLHRQYQGFQSNGNGYNRRLDSSLSHMVQWHPAILSRMAIIPKRTINSSPDEGDILQGQQYSKGDFVKLLRSTNENENNKPTLDKLTEQLKSLLKSRVGVLPQEE